MALSEETGEGTQKSPTCFSFVWEKWVCTLITEYPFTRYIPVVMRVHAQ